MPAEHTTKTRSQTQLADDGLVTTAHSLTLTVDDLTALPVSFFKAVDTKDVDAVVSHFAPDATFTVQTSHATFTGTDEIHRMFTDFINNSKTMSHEVENIVVEERTRKVVTEQSYIGELADGSRNDMNNCNIFDIDADGKFTRVVVWMAGTNPLK